ncbi:PLD nuclease N-terminal domain-containing protein [Saccharopolyspora sp. NPDC050389]|uniref:PLD nuclease N-terminal domain-containing protein n=1 Tax=Saccharopolyspora sp. NPDC050389 TaxID=3155516 RepID=UPI0033E5B95F
MHSVVQQAALAADIGLYQVGLIVATLAVLGYVALVIGALISVLGSHQGAGMKLVWIVFVFIAPFLGSLLWFFIGRRSTRYPYRTA